MEEYILPVWLTGMVVSGVAVSILHHLEVKAIRIRDFDDFLGTMMCVLVWPILAVGGGIAVMIWGAVWTLSGTGWLLARGIKRIYKSYNPKIPSALKHGD